MTRPICYVLVGPPGSGKTTWRMIHAADAVAISTDDYIDSVAREKNSNYSDVFKESIGPAKLAMHETARYVAKEGLDAVWDQTNMSKKSRKKVFSELPDHKKIAVVFDFSDRQELNRRLANRPGKIIPQEAVDLMVSIFEMPTVEEGFESVILAGDNNG